MKGLLSLIKKSTPSSFTYICEKNGNNLIDKVKTTYLVSPFYIKNYQELCRFDIVSFSIIFRWMNQHALLLECWLQELQVMALRKKKSFLHSLERYIRISNVFRAFSKVSAVFLLLFSPLYLQLAWTCYNFYQSTPTKLAGENYFFNAGQVSK